MSLGARAVDGIRRTLECVSVEPPSSARLLARRPGDPLPSDPLRSDGAPGAPEGRQRHFSHPTLLAALMVFVVAGASRSDAAPDFSEAIRELASAAQTEIDQQHLSGVSVALVDGSDLVWSAGFGFADKARRRPASSNTVYRVGSISKLFTALAAMQLAEQGRLDIDAPIDRYVPEFRPVNPDPDRITEAITARQLMCHRSGLVREAPVGGYFDASEPSAEATVASLADCVRVHPPDTQTKYSNSGVTVVGRAVEALSGQSFADYQRNHVLNPLGMAHSAFIREPRLDGELAKGYLLVAQASGGFREITAPQFEFGILPAGNLYSTAPDLGRFLVAMLNGAQGPHGRVVRPETLAEMTRVQMTSATNGFGLGFSIGWHRGQRTLGHMGAVYGFTSHAIAIPESQIGAVILANDDLAIGPVRRLAFRALDHLLAAKGIPTPRTTPPAASAVHGPGVLEAFAGSYESESYWAEITPGSGGHLRAMVSRETFDLAPIGEGLFLARGRMSDAAEVRFPSATRPGQPAPSFTLFGQTFTRVDPQNLPSPPESWRAFTGSYGPEFIPLIVTLRNGHLYAMTENEYDYRLHPVNRTVFRMPPGLYQSEQLIFERDQRGRVHGVLLANMPLKRRR
ncbi:MAG: beta-lactamase family protein [Verrucomicrobiales bacterium]|nr:beta-lactamase family protein [Verrucomicrobiales bacterium]